MPVPSHAALPARTARVLDARGRVMGTGFLVTGTLVLTCAHVVDAAGSGPGRPVRLDFPHGAEGGSARPLTGRVRTRGWRPADAGDIAVVELDRPVDREPLALSAAADALGSPVHSYGYPDQAWSGGHFGGATAGHLLSHAGEPDGLLQLTQANDITRGFSGGPVVAAGGRVVGMVTALVKQDAYLRGQHIAYATTSEALRRACPELGLVEDHPYRGLAAFTEEDARYFCGRETAVARLGRELDDVAGRGALLLLGPSGSGKTSLVRAGLLPRTAPAAPDRRNLALRPLGDLGDALAAAGLDGAETLGLTGAVAGALASDDRHSRILLVVDPFEELLTTDEGTGRDWLRRITACAREPHPGLTLLLVMRDDFYPRLAALAPDLLDAPGLRLLNMPATLTRDELTEIMEKPARLAGHGFQDGLRDRVIEHLSTLQPDRSAAPVTSSASASAPVPGCDDRPDRERYPVTLLPLLQLTLEQLWRLRTGGELTHEAYHRIEYVTGSLRHLGRTTLDGLDPRLRLTAERFLAALVEPASAERRTPAVRRRRTFDELRALSHDTGAGPDGGATAGKPRSLRSALERAAARVRGKGDASRRPPSEAGADADFDTVLGVLTGSRLVVTSRDAAGTPVAELVHDALIPAWPSLGDWVARDSAFSAWLDAARRQHDRWAPHRAAPDLLSGTALEDGRSWHRQRRLPPEIGAFVELSRQHSRRAVRRAHQLNAALALLLVLALTAAGLAYHQRARSLEAQRVAGSRQLAAVASALLATDPDLAAVLAVGAYRRSPTQEAANSLYQAADRPLAHVLDLAAERSDATALAFAPGGRVLAAAQHDGRVLLWDTANGRLRATLTPPGRDGSPSPPSVVAVAFSPDGLRLATHDTAGGTRFWDIGTGRVLRTVPGVQEEAGSAAVSPDWTAVTRSSPGGEVSLIDPGSGRTRLRLTGHRKTVTLAAYSPDGRTLATGSTDGTVRLWDTSSGRPGAVLPVPKEGIAEMEFSADGRLLATHAHVEGVARIWDTTTGRQRSSVPGHQGLVSAMAFSPNGAYLATSAGDGYAAISHASNGRLRTYLPGHVNTVNSVAYSAGGDLVVTAGDDGTARLYSAGDHELRMVLRGPPVPLRLATFSTDGTLLAIADTEGGVRLWDTRKVRPRPRLGRHLTPVVVAEFSRDGKELVTVDGRARLWDTRSGTLKHQFTGYGGSATDAAVSTARDTVIIGDSNGTTAYRDRTGGQLKARLEGHRNAVEDLAVSPDEKTVATAGADGTVRLWAGPHPDAFQFDAERAVLRGHRYSVGRVEFSPDGDTLASAGSDGTMRLWSVSTGRALHTLRGHDQSVHTLAFSPDGRTVAAGGADHAVRVWDVGTGTLRAALGKGLSRTEALAFSPDGHRVAAIGSSGLTVWDLRTGRRWSRELPYSDSGSVAFSPDGSLLAGAGQDGTTRIWDTEEFRLLNALPGTRAPGDSPVKTAFSPDGSTLFTAADKDVRLWDVDAAVPERAMRHVCRVLHLGRTTADGDDYTTDFFEPFNLDTYLEWPEIRGLCPTP